MTTWQIGDSGTGDNFLKPVNDDDYGDGCDADQLAFRALTEEYDQLEQEFSRLEDAHKNFNRTVAELEKYQNDCFKEIKHQKYRMAQIKSQLIK